MIRRALFPSPVHRRLAPLTAASFFGGVALWVPVEKLFLAEIGFTPQTIGLMAAAYAAVVPLLEIPSGILADRWSRRGVLLIGNAGAFLSVLVGGLSTNVATYLVAALLLGVYFAMQSGTFDAIVYDTVLEETGDSERFESILGRVRMVESASLVLGALGRRRARGADRTAGHLLRRRCRSSSSRPLFLLAFREPRLHETGEPRSLRQHVAVTFGVVRHDRRLAARRRPARPHLDPHPGGLRVRTAVAGRRRRRRRRIRTGLGRPHGLPRPRRRARRPASPRQLHAPCSRSACCWSPARPSLVVSSHVVVVTVAQVVVAMLSVVIGIFLTRVLHDAVPSDVRSGVASGVGAATWATFLPFALGVRRRQRTVGRARRRLDCSSPSPWPSPPCSSSPAEPRRRLR